MTQDVVLEWHLVYLSHKSAGRIERSKGNVAPPGPFIPENGEKREGITGLFRHSRTYQIIWSPKTLYPGNCIAGRVANGKAE